jgi:hypothetical protein
MRYMSNILSKVFAALLVVVIAAGGGFTPALAADADFNGEGASRVWSYDSANVYAYGYDAFGSLTKDLAPGDTRTVSVRLRNNTSDNVAFRLAITPLTGAQAQALEAQFPGKTADDSLLDAITLTVRHGTTQLYRGTMRGAAISGNADAYSASGASLGLVSAGYSGVITVEIALAASLGNDVMNTLCAIEWSFFASQYNDIVTPPPPVVPPATPQGTPAPVTAGTVAFAPGAGPVLDDTPTSEIPNAQVPTSPGREPTPDIDIEAEPVPFGLGEAGQAWALSNLLLTFGSGVLMLLLLLRYLLALKLARRLVVAASGTSVSYHAAGTTKSQSATPASWQEASPEAASPQQERRGTRAMLKGTFFFVGVAAIIIAILLFILTEDMRLPMQWLDRYTIWHIVIVIAELIVLLIPWPARKRR